ncbi:short-chain dehydrogenase [Meiothermus granaticius NBRC 107808]|nr:short-chain dehydrogenase [Meiothermus granaticius NBRC 107808]
MVGMSTLVVGATGGLGQALARALSGRGGKLFLLAREARALGDLASSLGGEALPADLASELEVSAALAEAGPLDLLIYAAGAVSRASLREMSRAEAERIEMANCGGVALTLKYARFTSGARVILLGVYPELVTVPGLAAYAASKLGAEALLNVARKEFRREGVRCTLVRLPAVATGLWAPLGGPPKSALQPQEAAARILDRALVEPPPEVVEL